jgi:hypothetical protein
MSIISNLFKAVLGGAPKTSAAPTQQLTKDRTAAAAARSSTYATEGGILGQELDEGQVKNRSTVFGN